MSNDERWNQYLVRNLCKTSKRRRPLGQGSFGACLACKPSHVLLYKISAKRHLMFCEFLFGIFLCFAFWHFALFPFHAYCEWGPNTKNIKAKNKGNK